MGTAGTDGAIFAMPAGVWAAIVTMSLLLTIGVVGLGYFLAYPEIKPGMTPLEAPPASATRAGQGGGMGWDAIMRTSKPEERRILEVLAAHDGTYLQKFVAKETGLSKLKTHRIVARLSEREVVTMERSGNTNEVSLAAWARPETGVSTKP